MDEYRQALTVNSKLMIYVFTEWASQGFQGEARRYVAPWVLSPPRRQAGAQTPDLSIYNQKFYTDNVGQSQLLAATRP